MAANPELSYRFWPWLVFLWVVCLPCFAVLVLAWRVSSAIRRDEVFTMATARLVKISSWMFLGCFGLFFIGNLVLGVLNMSHISVMLASLFIDVLLLALTVVAAVFARYISRGAELQDESDGTI